jgi:hypothetical protein
LVLKLDSSGDYQWHTFFGAGYGGTYDEGHGIAVDGSGNPYVAIKSDDTWTGPSGEQPKNDYVGGPDIAVLKLNGSGEYQWHTFFGADGGEVGLDLALNSGAGVFVVGRSLAPWLYASTDPAHQYTGGADLVIVKVSSAGAYGWHTFYGSSDEDLGQDIAVDNRGYIHAAGTSRSTWAGDGDASPLHKYTGDQDLFELVLADTAPVPTVGGWGLIVMAVGLWAASIWMIRRRGSAA